LSAILMLNYLYDLQGYGSCTATMSFIWVWAWLQCLL
jgi:hypothetical protein